MRLILIGAACACVAGAAAHANDGPEKSDKEWITETVNLLSDCSGLFEFMSEIFTQSDQPATAEQMHNTANGARMAAAYLLSVERATSGGDPTPIRDFYHYPEGRGEANKARLRALLEQQNAKAITEEQNRCIAALPMQDELVQMIRNQSVDR